ncbi:Mu-like prophage tail sheath protein gpL [Rodentibacter pneumotropicus]|uniref:Mu-like prophage tail sheath protein gpL n=1 Tax=Rodentibacter pneumotropicus TaxID=758 RepID=A0A3S4XU99_9PAST|nr:Mu-like prophage tail sheath protein gpL [Rodentibacter pneumotropicus]
MIGGVDYAVAISKAETADHVASRLNAVINAGEYCPITAAVEEGTVSLTAKCKGEIGNEIEVSAKITAGDMAVNATTLANGAENADLAAALASVAGEHYHVIISPFADDKNAKALREHLDTVASPMEKNRVWAC